MIGYLEGEVKLLRPENILLLVEGVGYDIFISSNIIADLAIGDRACFYIYSHIREDQFSLYGFGKNEDLDFFKMLLSVSGIGPKVALAIVSSAPVEKIKTAITRGDSSLLAAVSGVGKKTAEKTVIELKERLGSTNEFSSLASGGDTDEICSALIGLGFRREEVLEGLRKLPEDVVDSDEKIKYLLKNLGRR